jgi:aminodeoxyfutalosine synthase
MAGATSPQQQTEAAMLKVIRDAGRTPVQRNTFYQSVKFWNEPDPGKAPETKGASKVLEQNLATA